MDSALAITLSQFMSEIVGIRSLPGCWTTAADRHNKLILLYDPVVAFVPDVVPFSTTWAMPRFSTDNRPDAKIGWVTASDGKTTSSATSQAYSARLSGDRKSTRLNSSHQHRSRMPSSA